MHRGEDNKPTHCVQERVVLRLIDIHITLYMVRVHKNYKDISSKSVHRFASLQVTLEFPKQIPLKDSSLGLRCMSDACRSRDGPRLEALNNDHFFCASMETSGSDSLRMEGAPSAPSTPKLFKLLSPLSTSLPDTTPLSGDDCAVYDLDQASHLSLNDSKARKKLAPRRKDAGTSTPKRTKRRKLNRSDMSTLGSGYSSVSAAGKIFRNLLILEELLREQVVEQRALRRKYLTFLAVLCLLMALLSHHLYFTDAENAAKGTTRAILQLILVALLVTLMLYHLLGEYQKTIVLPRKFMSSTNKGLRQLNVRLMKIKTPWSDQVPDLLREIFLTFITYVLKVFHTISPSSAENRNLKIEVFLVSCQAQCQPRIGVTGVKLVLNSRVFNTDIREGWEIYRNEFWINEGMRRRKRLLEFTEKKKRQPQGKEKEKDS